MFLSQIKTNMKRSWSFVDESESQSSEDLRGYYNLGSVQIEHQVRSHRPGFVRSPAPSPLLYENNNYHDYTTSQEDHYGRSHRPGFVRSPAPSVCSENAPIAVYYNLEQSMGTRDDRSGILQFHGSTQSKWQQYLDPRATVEVSSVVPESTNQIQQEGVQNQRPEDPPSLTDDAYFNILSAFQGALHPNNFLHKYCDVCDVGVIELTKKKSDDILLKPLYHIENNLPHNQQLPKVYSEILKANLHLHNIWQEENDEFVMICRECETDLVLGRVPLFSIPNYMFTEICPPELCHLSIAEILSVSIVIFN
jgi:hypothetical protein